MKGSVILEPKRILYVNGGTMQRGGIESFMMSYYRNIDKQKLQIDFVVHGFEEGVYDKEIRELGGRIYNIPVKSKDYFGNISNLKSIFKHNDYKIVHSHLDAMSTVVLKTAKKSGIPIRIAHSHNIEHLTNNKLKYLINEQARKKINRYSTHSFACSIPAGEWLFGKNQIRNGNVKIIKNAIDLNSYCFNSGKRKKLREKLNIGKELVIGHVGRFDNQKNHEYLIDMFYELQKQYADAILILVGDGVLRERIQEKVKHLEISDKVKFLGSRDDVNELLNIFDIFVLPSKFEGLGISLIEAQANGLKCVTSVNTPKDVNVSQKVRFLDTTNSEIQNWINEILNDSDRKRENNLEKLIVAGYDIKVEAVKLQNLYLQLLEG